MKTNEDLTRRLIRGYSEGVQWLKDNKTAGIRAIQKYARIKDPDILEATYGEARSYIETVPYASRKGLETIIAELISTEAKGKQAKPDDFLERGLSISSRKKVSSKRRTQSSAGKGFGFPDPIRLGFKHFTDQSLKGSIHA